MDWQHSLHMHRPRSLQYRVKKGDTLSAIALAEYGNARAWVPIARANRLRRPYRILVGMSLRIPTLEEIGHQLDHIPVAHPELQSARQDIHPPATNNGTPHGPNFTLRAADY